MKLETLQPETLPVYIPLDEWYSMGENAFERNTDETQCIVKKRDLSDGIFTIGDLNGLGNEFTRDLF